MRRIIVLISFICLFWVDTPGDATPPEKPFLIAIDVGHTQSSRGAISARGKAEFDFNLTFARELQTVLTDSGSFETVLINANGKIGSLQHRTADAGKAGADFFLSIHHDSAQPKYFSSWKYNGKQQRYSDHFQGYSIFYSEKNIAPQESFRFGQLLGGHLQESGFSYTDHHAEAIAGENRPLVDAEKGVYRFDDLIVLKTAQTPAILLECGVIVNRDEELLLSTPAYRRKMQLAVLAAFQQYFEK